MTLSAASYKHRVVVPVVAIALALALYADPASAQEDDR